MLPEEQNYSLSLSEHFVILTHNKHTLQINNI